MQHIIIYEGYSGIFWSRGKMIRELPPGKYRFWPFLGQLIQTFDRRPLQLITQMEEFATKDHLNIRANMQIRWRLIDPMKMARATDQPYNFIAPVLLDQLREEVMSRTLDDVLLQAGEMREAIRQKSEPVLREAGIEIVAFSPLNILLPRSLKQAFEAETVARKRAIADMEEARGRTAVLRHLANAASLVDQQPALLQLLMGQKAKHVQFHFNPPEAGRGTAKTAV